MAGGTLWSTLAWSNHELSDDWLRDLRQVADSRVQFSRCATPQGARGKFEILGYQIERLEEGAHFLEHEAVRKIAVRLTLPGETAGHNQHNWRRNGSRAAAGGRDERSVAQGFAAVRFQGVGFREIPVNTGWDGLNRAR